MRVVANEAAQAEKFVIPQNMRVPESSVIRSLFEVGRRARRLRAGKTWVCGRTRGASGWTGRAVAVEARKVADRVIAIVQPVEPVRQKPSRPVVERGGGGVIPGDRSRFEGGLPRFTVRAVPTAGKVSELTRVSRSFRRAAFNGDEHDPVHKRVADNGQGERFYRKNLVIEAVKATLGHDGACSNRLTPNKPYVTGSPSAWRCSWGQWADGHRFVQVIEICTPIKII